MTINVNNTQQNIKDAISLEAFLSIKNISGNGIAIAINNVVITKREWDTTVLQENDAITIIQATQGG